MATSGDYIDADPARSGRSRSSNRNGWKQRSIRRKSASGRQPKQAPTLPDSARRAAAVTAAARYRTIARRATPIRHTPTGGDDERVTTRSRDRGEPSLLHACDERASFNGQRASIRRSFMAPSPRLRGAIDPSRRARALAAGPAAAVTSRRQELDNARADLGPVDPRPVAGVGHELERRVAERGRVARAEARRDPRVTLAPDDERR